MMFFGYNAAGPFTPALSFGSVNAAGAVTRFDRFEAPYASMVHDFIVTENHLLFPILPITGSMQRAMSGKPAYAWEPEKGAYVGVMKRQGKASDIVWFRAESCYVFHVMNAWEEGNRIIADVMQFEEAPLFTHPDGSPTDPKKSRRGCAAGLSISPAIPTASRKPISTTSRANSRASTIAAPALPAPTAGTPAPTPTCRRSARSPAWCMSTARDRGAATICCPPATPFPKPVFVARGNDAAEGDGWLLAMVWRARENRSDLAVFNATDVEAGPVALVQLGHRVPDGFHGNWVGAA